MAIRSLKDFQITIGGRTFTNEAWESDWFKGIYITIDDKNISTTAKGRRICSCGNVDDQYDGSCPKCGNTTWFKTRIGRWGYRNHDDANNRVPQVVDDSILGISMKCEFNTKTKQFVMKEVIYDVLENKGGFYSLNDHTIDAKLLNNVFDEYIADKPDWDNMRKLLQMYPADTIKEWMSWVPESTKDVKVLLYNIYKAIPGIDLVSRELFRAILESFVRQQNTCHKSVNDFLKFIKAPIALSEVYPIMGLPQHCDLMVLDQCNQDFVDVIIHALLHNRITFQELYTMLSGHNAEEINLYGFDLTDFVRRNIVKHGSQTYKAFISVYSTSKTNMKEANLARLDAYCKKKGIKTFPAAYESLMAGDGFGFLAALAGETK